MTRILVPGFYGFTNNKILAVTSFSSFIILFSNMLLYFLNGDNHSYNSYELYDDELFFDTFRQSIYIITFFYFLDIILTNKFWDKLGEKEEYVDESETPMNNNFILRPMNSHSSIFLTSVGLYSFNHINKNTIYLYASYFFSISQILMGIMSYLWWASNVNNIHIIDNLCMEQIVNSLSILIWTTLFPTYELFFIFLSILYFILHFFYFKKEKLFELCIIFMVGSFSSSYYYGSGNQIDFFVATILTLGGLVPKITDRVIRFQLGTTIFHFMESFGFLIFYKWVQTIPTINTS